MIEEMGCVFDHTSLNVITLPLQLAVFGNHVDRDKILIFFHCPYKHYSHSIGYSYPEWSLSGSYLRCMATEFTKPAWLGIFLENLDGIFDPGLPPYKENREIIESHIW